MATHDLTRKLFGLVVLLAIGAAVFRVVTAPERIREHRNTAHSVCLSSGGRWIKVDGQEVCRRGEPASSAAAGQTK